MRLNIEYKNNRNRAKHIPYNNWENIGTASNELDERISTLPAAAAAE